MTSLRARLVTGLLALTALGMVALGAITYAEQRSFQYDRVDDQVRAATGPLARELRGAQSGPFAPPGPPPPGRGRGPEVGLPPGTYGQLRTAGGGIRREVVLSFDGSGRAPKLPASLPEGEIITVDGGAGERYRVLARAGPGGRAAIVAAVPLAEADQTLRRLLIVEGLVIAGVLLVLGIAASFVVRLGLRPLDEMAGTAGAIAAGDLSRRIEPSDVRTEAGRLGVALNEMLERLQGAFAQRQASEDQLRRFLADASHELRTPLSSIRGYAELFRIGAARRPADVEKAMRRIEEESARMGVLVEDLLALARLDERREMSSDTVDLAPLVRNAADDAQATAPTRLITVMNSHRGGDDDHGGDVSVVGDEDGLRQVLANLLSNALAHTPLDAAIEVGVQRSGAAVQSPGDEVLLTVRDYGPGLPTDTPSELFQRFWRAEQGRERGRAGAGLGLAIVAGIVERHGGVVTAADAPGGGALFTVRLPAAPTQPRHGGDISVSRRP